MFFRTESFKDFITFYPVVTVIVAVNLLLWLFSGFLEIPLFVRFVDFGVGFNLKISNGEWWRLFTPIFLHDQSSVGHVLFNSFSLVLFGPALEQMLGKVKFMIGYVGAGVIGNIGTYLFAPDIYLHLGASGSIYGLFGFYLFMILFRQRLIDESSKQIVTVILVIGIIMTFLRSGINIYGHLFGFLGGLLLAPLLLINAKPFSPWRNERRRRDDHEYGFDPNRWSKRNQLKRKYTRYAIWAVILIILLLGLIKPF
ncbi:membrane protein [Pontibacillus halophilus JSM 076056 = DSM 19796]|uniref:Membrane protein n=1 Tax=Pontibacillus halophilus JSM 076056 = DSM 19796 TaxID=1385510 RepID=A0A0A5I422_9BACI|nr:rhomboid family intramembrane serine protease [Pontibacillus halophilus]KGX90567.1 membrane protein [Pontibacillus halophilus JSM 076056 = DSM 19796]